MRNRFVVAASLAGLLTLASNSALADQWNKLTFLTVNETIQVPGATLPPGKYAVRLLDSQSNRHIVQFLNADRTELITTVLAIPNERMQPSGDTQLSFYETAGNEPPALRAWFYPGDNRGQQFVYPKEQARVLARSSRRAVPTTDDDAIGQLRVRDVKAVPTWKQETRIYVWNPDDKEDTWERGIERNAASDTPEWWTTQRTYQRYGKFNPDTQTKTTTTQTSESTTTSRTTQQQASAAQTGSHHSQSDPQMSRQSGQTGQTWRGYEVLPSNLSAQRASVDGILRNIGDRGDQFEKDFKNAIQSSTVKIEDRDELLRIVDRLEDTLGELEEEYKENDMQGAHKELGRALEVAAMINRFMLRSEFGAADRTWAALRDDLNRLASVHTIPAIPVIVIERSARR